METRGIPASAKRWNWGAFLLNVFWGIGNRTPIAVLALIPVLNIFVAIYLGLQGGKLAWANRSWRGVEHYDRIQRIWAVWGFVVVGINIVVATGWFLFEGVMIEFVIIVVSLSIGLWYGRRATQQGRGYRKWALVGFGLGFVSGMIWGTCVAIGFSQMSINPKTVIEIIAARVFVGLAAYTTIGVWVGVLVLLGLRLIKPERTKVV